MSHGMLSLIILFAYLAFVMAIGYYAWKRSLSIPEDYYLAGRSLSSLVLFCAVLGTNMSGFVLVGAPGAAYHGGYATFGYAIGISGMVLGLSIYLGGYRPWLLSKKFGYYTMGEVIGDRYESNAVLWVTFVLSMIYMIPYLEIGAIGGGVVFEELTDKLVPYWFGAVLCVLVVVIYVWWGGMRGTAWTNTFHVIVFLAFLAFVFFWIAYKMGGFHAATAAMPPQKLWLGGKGPFTWQKWFSFAVFVTGFCIAAFPHVTMRTMSAKSITAIKRMTYLYPLGVTLTWFPAITIGAWGAGVFPGLKGIESDKIMAMMVSKYAPLWATGVLGAGILAAILSTIDSQVHTMGTMITREVIRKIKSDFKPATEVLITRICLAILCVITLILALGQPKSIIQLAEISFSGFACMVPAVLGGLYWKRGTKWGALFSLIVPAIMLIFYFYVYTKPPAWATLGGFLPVIPSLLVSVVLYVVVSLLTKPHEKKVNEWWAILDKVQ